jgi:endonuclease G
MKKLLWALLLLPILAFANPIDDICPDNVIWGAPKLKNDVQTQYICRTDYAVNIDYKTKVANYVVEHIEPSHLLTKVKRKNDFREDKIIPVQFRATLEDYSGEKYDRGHLAPAADFSYDKFVMSESFLLSNMIPQNKYNNRIIWRVLEEHVRGLAKKYDTYVITGTVFYPTHKSIGNGVGVPDEIYKIVITNGNKLSAYLFPNKAIKSMKFERYKVSVAEIEKITEIDFSPSIPVKFKGLELHP